MKKIKNKKNTPNKEQIQKVNKFKEVIISIFGPVFSFAAMLISLSIIIGLFTGFKYPWKWIDDLHITEKEKLEIIENNWRTAYTPLISWCSENATTGNKKSASKKNIISLMGDEKNVLKINILELN